MKYQEFLGSKNQSPLLLLPNCLAFHLDGENDYIVLEDVSPQGFGPAARQSCLTFEQCRYILEAMARFHGVSFAYKDQCKEDFNKRASKLSETYFSNDLYESWYKRFHVSKYLINFKTINYSNTMNFHKFLKIHSAT